MYAMDATAIDLGIEINVPGPGSAVATMVVTDAMTNGFDFCHGGYIFLLADTAFAYACNTYDDWSLAAGAAVEFLRPAKSGDTLHATANEKHRGKTRGLYEATVKTQDGKTIAMFTGRSHSTGEPML
jgi:acyl-CoA thioesterase